MHLYFALFLWSQYLLDSVLIDRQTDRQACRQTARQTLGGANVQRCREQHQRNSTRSSHAALTLKNNDYYLHTCYCNNC